MGGMYRQAERGETDLVRGGKDRKRGREKGRESLP